MLAFHRDERGYRNLQLVEQPNGDFGQTIARQLVYTAASKAFWLALMASSDARLAAVAGKAAKESAYHFRHAAAWTVRLGDGTAESAGRMQAGLDGLWEYTGELFEPGPDDAKLGQIAVDRAGLKPAWDQEIDEVLARAQLTRPADSWMARGGREGLHGEHLGHVLAEMQSLQRSYPGLKW